MKIHAATYEELNCAHAGAVTPSGLWQNAAPHYFPYHLRQTVSATYTVAMRPCPRCKEKMPAVRRYCRPCMGALSLKWQRENPIKRRRQYLRYKAHRYNLTIEEYVALFVRHNWSCAICDSKSRLSIDHNHQTGKVRGILCHRCNITLGRCGDDAAWLKQALVYLGIA